MPFFFKLLFAPRTLRPCFGSPAGGGRALGEGFGWGRRAGDTKEAAGGGRSGAPPPPPSTPPAVGSPLFPSFFPPSFLKRERRRGGRQAAVEVSPPSPAAEEIRREANNVIHCWGARPLGLFIFRTLAAVIFDLPTSSAEFLLEAGDVLGGEELGIFLCSQRATVWCLFTPEFH